MRIVGRERLDLFCEVHADARTWIANWIADAVGTVWRAPQSIKDRYRSASTLANNVVVFNVKGNRYRLEVVVAYRTGIITIVWLGTHAEYDQRKKERLEG